MLSRTADHLYWMARYIERAENMARVLEVTYSMSLVPNAAQSEAALWLPALEISGNVEAYEDDYGDVNAADMIYYLAMDADNPSSIYNALRNAYSLYCIVLYIDIHCIVLYFILTFIVLYCTLY